ncbi:hypothetical protein J6590_040010 [Homalodisca vitripennis]|nr:hypothetical protein J6590_040010 [Homalodisca vitripennis]
MGCKTRRQMSKSTAFIKSIKNGAICKVAILEMLGMQGARRLSQSESRKEAVDPGRMWLCTFGVSFLDISHAPECHPSPLLSLLTPSNPDPVVAS